MQRVRYGITVRPRAASQRGGSYFLRKEAAQIAVTKILARKGPLADGINYILNEEKTDALLTVHLNCDPGREVREMLDTKQAYGKKDGVQYYHVIQSFKPGEVTPELALEIATEFAREHLPGFETVISVHVDKEHIHAHLIFNSVNADTGRKYHSNAQTYYKQLRAASDRLCREHGLSVIIEGDSSKAVRADGVSLLELKQGMEFSAERPACSAWAKDFMANRCRSLMV